tara:strand:- start:303 stop:539 length:237 start_codon:yes stop_codon:yes gene_type:complete
MKAYAVYYAVERKTGEYVCMGIGDRGAKAKLKDQMYADMAKKTICSKYSSGAVYTDYGLVAIRSFPMPVKTLKKISEE